MCVFQVYYSKAYIQGHFSAVCGTEYINTIKGKINHLEEYCSVSRSHSQLYVNPHVSVEVTFTANNKLPFYCILKQNEKVSLSNRVLWLTCRSLLNDEGLENSIRENCSIPCIPRT